MNSPGFNVTNGKGFHIRFENGWTASVQFGPYNYCDNYDKGRENEPDTGWESSTAEIAAWPASEQGEWHNFGSGDTVEPRQSPAEVLEFLQMIAAKEAV